jgi:hypothetical protein
MAPLNFERVQAGEYQVNDGPKMVGYVRKQNSAKWILYKCSNPSMLGNPIAVSKTLKALKVEAETLIPSTYVEPVKAPKAAGSVDKYIKPVAPKSEAEERKFEIMREMLERDYVIDLTEYKQTEEGLEEIEVSVEEPEIVF